MMISRAAEHLRMVTRLDVRNRRALAALPARFVISRGAKTHVDVVVCTVTDGTHVGRGEGTPIYYHGETAEVARRPLRRSRTTPGAFDREALRGLMPPGAARNALDCALWDLEAQRAGQPVWALAGLPEPRAAADGLYDQPGRRPM